MFRAILGPASNVRFNNVPPIKEWHLTVRLDPDLVACMLSEDGKSGYMKAEFESLCEFSCM
jgi:hypothetical protein